MISLTYLKVVFNRGFSANTWHNVLEDTLIPELRALDHDKNGTITPKEVLRLVKRILASAFL